jgi:ribonuclease HI
MVKEKKSGGTRPSWSPPPVNVLKLNADAAVAKQEHRGAVGVVCRDSSRKFRGASALVFDGITDPSVLEALACAEAMCLAQDLQVGNILVASDCMNVVKDIISGVPGGQNCMIIKEILKKRGDFSVATFVHERREANTEAHRLSRSAIYLDVGRHVWLLTPPCGLNIPVNLHSLS